jgi:hypothetical protein
VYFFVPGISKSAGVGPKPTQRTYPFFSSPQTWKKHPLLEYSSLSVQDDLQLHF